jgi:HlyD family secretion protein
MRKRNTSLPSAIFGVSLLLMLTGCGQQKAAVVKPKKPPLVATVIAASTNLVEHLETTGDVIAVNAVTLEATVEGPISFCPWREGDRVERAGQKLIEISRPLYREELAGAEAAHAVFQAKLNDLKAGARPEEIRQARESVRHFEECTRFAKADSERTRSLVTSGTLPAENAEKARVDFVKCQTQLEAAKEQLAMLEAGPTITETAVAQSAVDEAAARIALAQAKLDECLLTAPFAGIITEVYVRRGDLATPRTKLLKMLDPVSLVIRAGVPESSAAHIRKGSSASVRLDAFPGKVFAARIERVHPRIEHDSRTRIIEIKLSQPAELLPHMFARVTVEGRIFENAVTIPVQCVITTPRGHSIVYVIKNGKALQRKVTAGIEQSGRIHIISGLEAGESVVTAGNLNLRDGTAVRTGDRKESPDNRGKGRHENTTGNGERAS